MTKNNQEQELSSLAEIMLRKELVQKDIDADDEKIKTLWNSLFKKLMLCRSRQAQANE